jgi:hypothetical protein
MASMYLQERLLKAEESLLRNAKRPFAPTEGISGEANAKQARRRAANRLTFFLRKSFSREKVPLGLQKPVC